MKIVALLENTKLEGREDLVAEHGLSLYIECNDKRVLFDTGASEAFEQNARKLSINLRDVDVLVILHHHFDHGGGLARFMEVNHKAKIYLRKSGEEDFYFRVPGILRSQGYRRGVAELSHQASLYRPLHGSEGLRGIERGNG
jgi:7,8-dihydropterin-6-yl-methyl-4-(beta-D-ribofuranosyl)aminobenzene 5'-phosphate synthase